MGCKAFFGHEVHAARAYLHFHPPFLRAVYGDMQRFVAVAFRYAYPVFHAGRVGAVHVGDYGIDEPALVFLEFGRYVEYYADGEKVVDFVKVVFLLFHLVPYRRYGLGAAFDFKIQAFGLQAAAHRLDEVGDVFFAVGFRLVEFSGYTREHLAVGVFEREIFELAFYGVESEAMGEGSVKVAGFSRHMAHGFGVRMVVYGLHQCKTVHNHYDYDTYVVGESKEKFAEIVCLDGGLTAIERSHVEQSVYHVCHVFSPVGGYLRALHRSGAHVLVQHQCERHIAVGAEAFGKQNGCVHVAQHRMQPEAVAA